MEPPPAPGMPPLQIPASLTQHPLFTCFPMLADGIITFPPPAGTLEQLTQFVDMVTKLPGVGADVKEDASQLSYDFLVRVGRRNRQDLHDSVKNLEKAVTALGARVDKIADTLQCQQARLMNGDLYAVGRPMLSVPVGGKTKPEGLHRDQVISSRDDIQALGVDDVKAWLLFYGYPYDARSSIAERRRLLFLAIGGPSRGELEWKN